MGATEATNSGTGSPRITAGGIASEFNSFLDGGFGAKGAFAFKNGDYGTAAGYYAAGTAYATMNVITFGEEGAIINSTRELIAGQSGRFADLLGTVGDDLTAHHMPQAALKLTSRADGGALVMTTEEHEATRTFGYRGAQTVKEDANLSFRDVLAKDIRDVRQIVGTKYNEGLQNLTDYYRENFPDLMKK